MKQLVEKQVSQSSIKLAEELKWFLENGKKCPLEYFVESKENSANQGSPENIDQNSHAAKDANLSSLKLEVKMEN